MNDFELIFNELFYGSGIWLGLIFLLTIIIGVSVKNRDFSVLFLPVTLFLGIDYLNEGTDNCLWGAVILFFASIFIVINLVRDR